ncbi:hypothetical protein HZS_6600 [Henneguya salminicola]|nr:hypothetical protein HZS_6600 [Henneguya salminicola]
MYRRVWEKVRENVEITCQTGICDFDKASINFFFNLSQCIWRRIQNDGQSTLYINNETARFIYNQINGRQIELMERRDTIPIITLLEQISYLLTH